MAKSISKKFFNRSPDVVAKDLLGKILVRKIGRKSLRAKIVEVEAYFDEADPGSWARLGKRKDNSAMWLEGGTILVKNVHKYFMLNFVTGSEGEAGAVLIRALDPINFSGRCSGPGLLSISYGINKELNGKNIFDLEDLFIEFPDYNENFEIGKSFRIGLGEDLDIPLRFYIKDNYCVSRRRKNG